MRAVCSSPSWVGLFPLLVTFTTLTEVVTGIMNYKWSITGIYDIYDKSIAALLLSLLAGAGAAYYKSGDRPTAATLAVVAIIQGLGVRSGSYSRLS
jgi:hypothetical protein